MYTSIPQDMVTEYISTTIIQISVDIYKFVK